MEDLPEWITVTPATGNGTTDVTVSVTDNMRDGAEDNPRKATIVFKGCTLASRAEVVVSQDGDKYRDCQEYTVDELPALEDETVVSVPEALVTAVTTSGCIVTDAQYAVNMFLQTATAVNVGDKVAVKGSKGTDAHALPYVVCDEVRVVSEGNNIEYPEAHDVTAEVDSYTSDSREWISASGVLSGNNLTIDGAVNSVSIIDAPESLNLAALNGHKVTVYGYFDGVAAPALRIQEVLRGGSLGSKLTLAIRNILPVLRSGCVLLTYRHRLLHDGLAAPKKAEQKRREEEARKDLGRRFGTFKVTYYWIGEDRWGYRTAMGVRSSKFYTVAVDPDIVPLGSILTINGEEYYAVDTGNKVQGNVIDIFSEEPLHEKWYTRDVKIVRWGTWRRR